MCDLDVAQVTLDSICSCVSSNLWALSGQRPEENQEIVSVLKEFFFYCLPFAMFDLVVMYKKLESIEIWIYLLKNGKKSSMFSNFTESGKECYCKIDKVMYLTGSSLVYF